ncbi:hypothetical protein SJI00_05895 [Pseudomonas sp. RP23018S]|uniref:hypothetical protein n=1 Tax=Pseudomonas sp. RP23018S TaxID=3096037 RepID=UPI002ACAF2A3|nr:hypothetical protein [Pseudomonas sp. RP23018S]MDZ5602297.1 hypothetical protein [Pseudomonas sp. RP23018S]
MSQISIPYVAFHPLEPQPESVAIQDLAEALKLPPELYVDADHHGRVYCPDCGVRCSRRPLKTPKRRDGVDAFYFHLPGFDEVECPHRKKGGAGAGGDPGTREKRAISLVTFAGWKNLESDDESDDDFDGDKSKPRRKEVQNGSSITGRNGFKNIFDAEGNLLNPGKFSTVGRLVQLAKVSLNIAVQFDGEDAILLRDLIVSIEKAQQNIKPYIGKGFLFFGRPTSIVKGNYGRVFFNFKSPEHELSGHCELDIFEARGWKTFERDNYYLFYGTVEGDEDHSIVRVLESGQIDRVPSTARKLFEGLR